MAAHATATRDPGQEFDDFEAGVAPDDIEDRAGGTTPPSLTLARLIPEPETITYEGRAYELRLLPHLSVGRQTALINHRNATLVFQAKERADDELTPEEEAANLFHYRRIARAAIPDLSQDDLEALTLHQLEAVASRFFTRSQERGYGVGATDSRPTSAP